MKQVGLTHVRVKGRNKLSREKMEAEELSEQGWGREGIVRPIE